MRASLAVVLVLLAGLALLWWSTAERGGASERPAPEAPSRGGDGIPVSAAPAELPPPSDPAVDPEPAVPPSAPTFVHGVACDSRGEPLAHVDVVARPHGNPDAAVVGNVGARGEFRIEGLGAGAYTLAFTIGRERREIALQVLRGPNELGAVRLDVGNAIEGRVVGQDGEPGALLLLSGGGHPLASQIADPGAPGDGLASYHFEGVPPGDYRLEILPFDGRRYRPPAARVRSPGRADFHASGVQNAFELECVDAAGARVSCGRLLKLRGSWMPDLGFARADVEEWIVLAEGFRPARGGRPRRDELRVTLQPGHGAAFLFLEGDRGQPAAGVVPCGRPLAGVELVADGQVVARSDASGLALLDLARPPDQIERRLAGWRELGESADGSLTTVFLTRE